MMSAFMGIPGLVGFWPQGFSNDSGDVTDTSGNANDLVNTTDVNWTRGGTSQSPPNAYVSYGNTGGHFFLGKDAAIYDIVGTEAFNASASQGLTMGGWFLPTNAGAIQGLITKWESTNATKAYALFQIAGNEVGFYIYNGGNHTVITTGGGFANSSGWHFCVGRFDPTSELKVWRNRETNINTTSIPATIQSSTGRMAIGARADAGLLFGGRGGICFLSNQYLEDDYVEHLYNMSRGYYKPSAEY